MAIYLVQHGESYSKDEDPIRGLTPEGEKNVRLIGGVAANYGVQPHCIVHSGKNRAKETAQILGECLGVREVTTREGLAPHDPVEPLASALTSPEQLMLVGHLPFMERLASYLITSRTDFQPFKFQNGGIVCLDQSKPGGLYHIRWALMPSVG